MQKTIHWIVLLRNTQPAQLQRRGARHANVYNTVRISYYTDEASNLSQPKPRMEEFAYFRHCRLLFARTMPVYLVLPLAVVVCLFVISPYNALVKAIRQILLIFFVLGSLISPASAQNVDRQERIPFYGSQIDIDASGRVRVTETIRVHAMGRDIKHGIFRSIATRYEGSYMETIVSPLEVISVLRDGKPEDYSVSESREGSTIYVGNEHSYLPAGDYTYTIVYTVDRVLGFFDDHDELYWNITGQNWGFAIDSVYAVVNVPPGAPIIKEKISAYSGASGESGCDCEIRHVSGTSVAFHTTKPLNAFEGLTVAVPFEKGIVVPPSRDEMIDYLIADNYPAVIAFIGLGIVLIYYIAAWLLVGVDPKGRITVRAEPPADLSPYELRYVKQMKFDNKAMVVALVSMAQNGLLTISERPSGGYTLTRVESPDYTPTAIEKTILDGLFANGSSITLDNTYNASIGQALGQLKKHLKDNFNNSAFRLNRPWIVMGILLSVVAVIVSAVQYKGADVFVILFMLVWISGWTAGCYALFRAVVSFIRKGKQVVAICIAIFGIPFLAAEIFVASMLAGYLGIYAGVAILLIALTNIVFFRLMKAPTAHGRQLLDEIDGFSHFLRTATVGRQRLSTSPGMDLRVFQQYLPYALALDVQSQWVSHFEDQLTAPGQTAHVTWYKGLSPSSSLHTFSSSFSQSFSSSISTSSTPPASGSGSGGGGFSGGGRGGGGGGGW